MISISIGFVIPNAAGEPKTDWIFQPRTFIEPDLRCIWQDHIILSGAGSSQNISGPVNEEWFLKVLPQALVFLDQLNANNQPNRGGYRI
jgi:hypothetical protein